MSNENNTEGMLKEKKLSTKRWWIILLAIIALIFGVYFVYEYTKYQTTDDAYVDTTTVSVSPKVSGQIVKVLVEDNQPVKAGDIIAVIDRVDYEVKLQQANASYEKELLNQENAHANLNAANSEIALAQKDVERYTKLYETGAISKQTLDKAQTNLEMVQARQTSAEQSIFSTNTDNASRVADANLNVLKANKRQAELAYDYTQIKASIDGTIANKKVEVGMMVQPGTPLCTIVPHNVWIIANYKETQVGKMKEGMPVKIKVDAYPNKTFEGKIDSIQRSSGAKSSMFPPENAVGSFVKIVQRIPVKIVFTENIDADKYKIIPGMSVIPKVKIK